MGAWGTDTFENDTACDWAYGLEGCSDLTIVHESLQRVLETSDDYLDADVAAEGLAACETVARLRGQFGVRNSYTESVDCWVAAHADLNVDSLLAQARQVIDRINGPDSELAELWQESDSYDEWCQSLANLKSRLS